MTVDQHERASRRATRRHRTSRLAFSALALGLIAVAGSGTLMTAQASKSKARPNPDSSNLHPYTQITKANVAQLQMAWYYPWGGPTFSPVFANNLLYGFGRSGSSIVALDPATGEEVWVHQALHGATSKGINYWESEDGKDKRLIFSVNSFMQQIDATTGKTITTFGTNGYVDLRVGMPRAEGTAVGTQPASPGRIWKNTLVIGGQSGESIMTPAGDIRAFDIPTGKLLWQFHTVPKPGEFGYETNPPDGWKYQGGANNWGELTIDEERGIAYVPTGSMTADFWGGDRHGQNLFANCLLALDVRTGKRLWHFQTIHHDLWDLDNVSAPQLATVRHNGQNVDIVAHAGKTGFLYVFNRVTGQPLWPIEERPVMQGNTPNEWYSPTQPFPTKPAPFARQSFTEDDVNPNLLTKQQYDDLRARVRNANNGTGPQGGIFVPTKVNGDSIGMPGNQGGANWGTTAADPKRGLVFVVGVNQVALLHVNDVQEPSPNAPNRGGGGGNQVNTTQVNAGQRAFTQYCSPCHGADQRGAIPGVPSLVGVTDRIDAESVRVIVSEGRNNMRPILDATNEEIAAIYAYLASTNPNAARGGGAGRGRGAGPVPPSSVVVATGGAQTPPLPARYGGPLYPGVGGTTGNMPWPTDVEASKLPTRYQSGYNVMATSTKPPYTTITAYDLNTGEIKWQVPNGDDPETVRLTKTPQPGDPAPTGGQQAPCTVVTPCTATGVTNTGGVGARNGIIVTSNGLLFQNGKDGFARAYDVETGKVLWKGKTAGQSIGIPAMYEYQGRQYVVFMSPPLASNAPAGAAGMGGNAATDAPATLPAVTSPQGYIAFALPRR